MSLALRVSVPVVLLVLTVAALVYLGLVRQSRAALFGAKHAAAQMVVRLTSVSVMPAVVFGDPEEMQRAVNDLSRNPDVTDVELWTLGDPLDAPASGPAASFHRAGKRTLGRPSKPRSESVFDADSVRLVEPVLDLQGKPLAVMVVRFTTAPELAALARLSRQILVGSALVALCLAAAIVWIMLGVVVRPVTRLQSAAQRLARGETTPLEHAQAPKRLDDEVQRLAEYFTDMAAAVRDREMRLEVRSAELKLILDSVEQGFLTVLPDGSVLAERSALIERWTGPLPRELKLWELIGHIDGRAAEWIDFAWTQLVDDFLPLKVAIEQMPKRLETNDRQIDVTYHPVSIGSKLDRLVVVLTDVT
ncbi:MAG TPA: HAMP domain-containing protein, partial [Polyangiaceae bacterium]